MKKHEVKSLFDKIDDGILEYRKSIIINKAKFLMSCLVFPFRILWWFITNSKTIK